MSFLSFGVYNIPPVQVAVFQGVDHGLGRSDVGGVGDVVHIAKAQQTGLVRLGGLGADGVAEVQQQVDLIAGNARGDLLVAALAARHKAGDVQAGRLRNQLARGAGGAQAVTAQDSAVSDAELDHQFLFGVVSDQCDIHGNASFGSVCGR